MTKAFEYKGVSFNNSGDTTIVKDIDEKQGIITGYFSVFGNVDSDGDIIMPGAFKRSLSNNRRRIKHLWQHNPYQPLSSAATENLKLKEDSYGLYFESKISETSWGRDAIKCYVDGTIDEHSIGFVTVKQRDSDTLTVERWGQKVPVKEIHEVKLWEGSAVTFGANELARTESIKSLTKEQAIEKMNVSLKAFREGTYEQEEIFDLLEIYVKQLQQHILDLTEGSTPPAVEAPAPQKGEEFKSEDVVLIHTNLLKLKLI